MSQTHLEVTYRQGQAFAAYLRLPRPRGAKVAATREVTPSILADVDASGQLLGLELLAPQTTTAAEVQAVLAQFHAAGVADRDLMPLRMAS